MSPHARAVLNVRVHPEQDAVEAQAAVIEHLRAARPFGIELDVRPGPTGNGFAAATDGPAYAAARAAWSAGVGRRRADGRQRRLDPDRQRARAARCPDAEALLVGTTDGYANIHGPNERVLLDEFEKAIVAEADFFGRYAEAFADMSEAARPSRRRRAAGSPSGRSAGSRRRATGSPTRRSCSSG